MKLFLHMAKAVGLNTWKQYSQSQTYCKYPMAEIYDSGESCVALDVSLLNRLPIEIKE